MDLLDIDITLPRRSFEIRAALTLDAETVALIGPSGAGKTSLLKTVAGLERPSAGRIALGDQLWFHADRRINLSAERRRVGYLPQDYGLFPHLTVAANVHFAGKRDRPDLLERVGISDLAGARPRELSGGERQRVALARALAREPHVLLLDEPFGALDAITRKQVRDELADLLRTLTLPALVVTHSFDDATALAHRIGVIDRGHLVQLATASKLLGDPATAMVAALTGANVLHGIATPRSSGSTIQLSGGGELASSTRARGPVEIVVQPWELQLAEPESSSLTDDVISVRHNYGRLLIRLTRFTIQTQPGNGQPPIAEGQPVGLRAAPASVRVLPPRSRP
jgi:molybdate transport system ATP-binding protein